MKKDDGWAVVWNFRINSLMSPCVSVRTPGKLVEKDNGWVVSNYHRIVIVPGNHKRFLTLRVFLWRLAVSRFYQFSDIDTEFHPSVHASARERAFSSFSEMRDEYGSVIFIYRVVQLCKHASSESRRRAA